jgi:hypothetical protein
MAQQENLIEVLREQNNALQGENCNLSKENAKVLQQMMQVSSNTCKTAEHAIVSLHYLK